MTKCNCGHIGPALEHNRNCPLRITFFGGSIEWDRTKTYIIEPDLIYQWDDDIGTWTANHQERITK